MNVPMTRTDPSRPSVKFMIYKPSSVAQNEVGIVKIKLRLNSGVSKKTKNVYDMYYYEYTTDYILLN